MPSPSKTNVRMGQFKGRKAGEEGLESGGFGTCVGVVVTGEPHRGGKSRFLFHISLGQGWSDIRKPWYEFAEAVEKSGMRHMKGYILTVDTSLNKDPEYKHDPDMQAEAAALEIDYSRIEGKLQHLVGHGTVVPATHAFAKVSHMSVDANNVVKVDGHRI